MTRVMRGAQVDYDEKKIMMTDALITDPHFRLKINTISHPIFCVSHFTIKVHPLNQCDSLNQNIKVF